MAFALIIKRVDSHGAKIIFVVAFPFPFFAIPSRQRFVRLTVDRKIVEIDTQISFDKINAVNSILLYKQSSVFVTTILRFN